MYRESEASRDWRNFKQLFPKWQERYLAKKNQEILKLLTEAEKTHIERFRNAKAKLDREEKILNKCYENHTRSNLVFALMEMYRCDLIGEEDLVGFSDDTRDYVMFAASNMQR